MSAVPLFRGANINHLVEALRACESQVDLFDETTIGNKKVYPDGRSQVVICTQLQRLMNWKIWARAVIGRKSIHEQFKSLVNTGCFADRIRIKNNALAFYSKYHFVCKYWLDSGLRARSDLQSEARAIRKVEESALLNVPKILQDNTDPNEYRVPAIWYESIIGTTPTGKGTRSTAIKLTKLFIPWYEHNAVEFVEPDMLCTQGSTSLYHRLLSYGWLPREAETILSAGKKTEKCGMSLPVSVIHGDASVGNTIIDKKGELFVLDWESSRRDFIAHDVSRLISQGGVEVRNIYERWLKSQRHRDTLPVDYQLNIMCIRSNLKLMEKEAYLKRIMPINEVRLAVNRLKRSVLSASQALCTDL